MDRYAWRRCVTGWCVAAVLVTACSEVRFADRGASIPTQGAAGQSQRVIRTAALPAEIEAYRDRFFDQDQIIPDSIRMETFIYVRETLRSEYFDSTFSGMNWDSLCTAYLPRLAERKESGAFHRMLNEMINRLGTSHLRITPPHVQHAAKASRRMFTVDGLSVRRMGDDQIITYVSPGSDAHKKGLAAGDIIISVDGSGTAEKSATPLLHGDSASVCRIVYLDRSNRENRVELPRLSRVITTMERLTRAKVTSKKLDDDIGYIAVDIWGINLADQMEQAFLQLTDTKALIVDVRQNPGGVGSDCLTRYIFSDSTITGHQVFRHGIRITHMSSGSGEQAYAGKIAVLTDSRSGSSSELFAANLQESGRAVIVGESSYGGVLNATQTLLPTGGAMLYPNGAVYTAGKQLLEGKGVTPDYTVSMKRDDLYNGIDTVIETAKQILKKALG
ncbi:PDZ domain-containing protein [bacterium]|nr:PDZ domain-containing protein [bacterium]